MEKTEIIKAIQNEKTSLGIELGSTRIKSVLMSTETFEVLASGVFEWENSLVEGLWTYSLKEAVRGLQESYRDLTENLNHRYGVSLERPGAIGISGMMHGYLVLDSEGKALSPFLTWRNTNTSQAADALTALFGFNIPLRWSIAHLYQGIMEKRSHIREISYMTTLSGYIHFLLTGEKVMGIGEASGMFPIDSKTRSFREDMLDQFQELIEKENTGWKVRDILPRVLTAGEDAGVLTEEGAGILDPSGKLKPGIVMAPPEGDAGTGMVATRAVSVGTGNVSGGTSIFAMIVLSEQLSRLYRDIDMVTTPAGDPVAMVHCNNGTSDLDSWMRLFREFSSLMGKEVTMGEIYEKLFLESLKGDPDCDGVVSFNYLSGEPVTGLIEGKPLLMREPDSRFHLANFMRSQIYAIVSSLSIGMEILRDEKVKIDRLTGHGGLFKTEGVAQKYLAMAVGAPISVMENAGEGGAFGMAVLAGYMRDHEMKLGDYLEKKVFQNGESVLCEPGEDEMAAFQRYIEHYKQALKVEKTAAEIT